MTIEDILNAKANQPRIAMFDLVSRDQFEKDLKKSIDAGEMKYAYLEYDNKLTYLFAEANDHDVFIAKAQPKLPVRATAGSAGYDFFSPFSFDLYAGESITIPTGIRCAIHPDWVLAISPKSGKGTRYRVMMRNTIGWVDSDYYHAENEGHIILKIINDNHDNMSLHIEAGDSIMQGIFIPYGITIDDNVTAARTGGFGSTFK